MTFATPAWLIGLVPWGIVTAYLVRRGVSNVVTVPFLGLWRGATVASRGARTTRRPPVGLLVACAGLLAAILAAAGPRGRQVAAGVVVVVDRGAIGRGPEGDRTTRVPMDAPSGGPVEVVCVPALAGSREERLATLADVESVPPTAVDTGAALDAAVGRVLRRTDVARVVVLTDRAVSAVDPRVTKVAPGPAAEGVHVDRVAARDLPRPQVMVRLRNGSGRGGVRVRVTSAGVTTTREVSLAAPGGTCDRFLDVPVFGPSIEVDVDPAVLDGRAWLAREAVGPRAVVGPGVPAAVRRVVDVFGRHSAAPSASGSTVSISGRPLSADTAGVWVVDSGASNPTGPVLVRGHPVTADVTTWPAGGADVPAGFSAVVTTAGRGTVAVREGRVRQVWVSGDLAAWSGTADFVVFFADALRWAGSEGSRFTSTGPGPLDAGWHRVGGPAAPPGVERGCWPGLYQATDGRLLAVNAAVSVSRGTVGAVVDGRAVREGVAVRGGTTTAPIIYCLAVTCLAGAAAVWPFRDGRATLLQVPGPPQGRRPVGSSTRLTTPGPRLKQ